jgi:two-component system chemotaxis response regulator CheB
MSGHDLIVVGASAGGVEALAELVALLPADLPAAVCVVVHIPATNVSMLPKILSRAGVLAAINPREGEQIQPGLIYIAPPDRHLLIQDGLMRLGHGPRENGHRPAIDPLFRSAARAYGPRVVGVVLSGGLDDGTAGLLAIKREGGVTIAQDPTEAISPGMPRSAIENRAADYVLPVGDIAPLLVHLAHEPATERGESAMSSDTDDETKIARFDFHALKTTEHNGVPSVFACPECNGTLFELRNGDMVRYRCRVGHAFSPDSLAAEQTRSIDEALWTAFRALEERAGLARRMAARMRERGFPAIAQRHDEQVREAEHHAQVLREVLMQGTAQPVEEEEKITDTGTA